MDTLYEKVEQKVEEIIALLDSSEEIKRLVVLKEQIKKDAIIEQEREQLLKEENPYEKETIERRVQFYSNPLVEEYKKLENDLFFFTMEMSQRLKKLLPERKRCK